MFTIYDQGLLSRNEMYQFELAMWIMAREACGSLDAPV